VRLRIDPDMRLDAWLVQLRREQAELNQYQNVSPGELRAWRGEGRQGRLFASLLLYQNFTTADGVQPWGRDLQARPLRASVTSHYPLTVVVTPGERFRIELRSRAGGPDQILAEALARQLTATLARMIRGPRLSLGELREAAAWSFAPPAAPSAEIAGAGPPPRGALEERIAATCGTVLGLAELGGEQNFFDLGADSASLLEIHARLQDALERSFPIVTLFQYPSVRALARHLEGGEAAAPGGDAVQRAALRRQRTGRHRQPRTG